LRKDTEERYYTLTVKTVTFERVIYEKILWVKGSKDSQTINGEKLW